MSFFKKIVSSVYSPEFYSNIPNFSLGSAIKYFLLLVFLIELVFFVKLAPEFLFSFSGRVKSFITSVTNTYPKDLVITLKSGEISTNVKEPYFITDNGGKKFAVIDTKTPYSAAEFNNYDVAVWLTKDTIFYKGDAQGQIKSQNLNQMPDMVINDNLLISLGEKVRPWVSYIGPTILVFMFLTLYVGYLSRLIYLFFLALLILVLSKIMRRNISYSQSYKVGIYAMTLAFYVDLVKMFTGWQGFAFMFTLISLAVVFVNFSGLPEQKK